MRYLYSFLFFFILATVSSLAQGDRPTASPNTKSFTIGPSVSGAGAENVNLFTGDVALPIPLLSLPGHNGLDVGVNISYSSNVQEQVSTWNLEAPTGILGLGWGMDMPKIVVDHKQNGAREDDEFYLIEGGGSTQLIRTTEGSDVGGSFLVYETKSYQLWKIKYYATSDKWEITKEDGTKYIYGDKNSNRQTIQWVVRWDNWIGNSAVTSNQTQMAQAWNLSEIVNLWNEKITFEYENDENFVGSTAGKKHTEASYLKRITDVLGRKVEFNYKLKTDISPFLVQEPHIEQAEPDAYQEFYERRYLDCIKVLQEDNSPHYSFYFTYSQLNAGTNTAKLLLTSITQKNKDGYALPPMQFEYYLTGNVGSLKSVTMPTGAKTTYNYGGISPNNTYNNSIGVPTPSGYSDPMVRIGEDYVVVMWRKLGTNGQVDNNAQQVLIQVYEWVGRWIKSDIGTFTKIKLKNGEYDFFKIILEKDFFAVLASSDNGLASNYDLQMYYKDPIKQGKWKKQNTITLNCGAGDNHQLYSGNNFVAVGTDSDGKLYSYIFKGDGFRVRTPYQELSGEFYGAATNNYILRHDEDGNPDHLYFYYLSERKELERRVLPSSIRFNSGNLASWYPSNSFFVGMISGFPEYIYRWDINYNNFYRDNVLGSLNDNAPVFLLDNSMIAINDKLARFNGLEWKTTNITQVNYFGSYYYSYGVDYALTLTNMASSNYTVTPRMYNPNNSSWANGVSHPNLRTPISRASINHYYVGRDCYVRQTNGSWVKKFSLHTDINNSNWASGYPGLDGHSVTTLGNFFELVDFGTYLYYFKNGELSPALSYSDPTGYQNGVASFRLAFDELARLFNTSNLTYNSKIQSITNDIIVSTSGISSNGMVLRKIIKDRLIGPFQSSSVTLITTEEGANASYTTINYDASSANLNAIGGLQYHKVTVANGTSTPNSYPQGRTEYYFYNGLTQAEVSGNTTLPISNSYALWTGTPYETKVYNASNQLLSSSKTTLSEPMTKVLNNSLGNQVGVAYYVRPIEVIETQEGVSTKKTFAYNTLGQLKSEIAEDVMYRNFSLGVPNTKSAIFTTYEYLHEKYNTSSTNQVSPTVSSKTQIKAWNPNNSTWIDETVLSFSANTWKQENGIWRPHKTYVWRRTGTPTFNFASWSGTGEPPSTEWTKVSEIDQIDSKGNVLQTTVR